MLKPNEVRERVGAMADSISSFAKNCQRREYTDTNAAWELLYRLRRVLRRLARAAAMSSR